MKKLTQLAIIIALFCLMAACAVKTTVTMPNGETCEFKSQRDAVLAVKTPEGFEFSADLTGNPSIPEQIGAILGATAVGTGVNIGDD